MIVDLRAQLEDCEERLEKGADYVDYLQGQITEMTGQIEEYKQAEEVRHHTHVMHVLRNVILR